MESAHVPTILELQGVLLMNGKRPDGMTIFSWKKGKCMVWDLTCSNTFAPSHIDVSSNHLEKMAEQAEQAKLTKYEKLERDFEIVPICVKTMGPWGPNGLKFVREVDRRISMEFGQLRSIAFLMQAIGMAIQRGNAASVLGTVCKGQHLEEMYYLYVAVSFFVCVLRDSLFYFWLSLTFLVFFFTDICINLSLIYLHLFSVCVSVF